MPTQKRSISLYDLRSQASLPSDDNYLVLKSTVSHSYSEIQLNTSMNNTVTPHTTEQDVIANDLKNVYMIGCNQDDCLNKQTLHLHPNYLAISYMQYGHLTYTFEGTDYYVSEEHGLIWDQHIRLLPHNVSDFYTLIFPKILLEQHIRNLPLFINKPIAMLDNTSTLTKNYFLFLIHHKTLIEKTTEPLFMNMFFDLIATTLNTYHTVPASKHKRDLLQNIKNYIDKNIKHPDLNPKKIAEQFSISTRYIHELFKMEGVTLVNYITDLRLEKCRRDLIYFYPEKKKVIDIAFKWGFNDAAHFSKLFKKKYGIAPSHYQKLSTEQHLT